MSLNKQKGNMYGFITHTWNPIRGKCIHDCIYCYMKVYPQKELRLDQKTLDDNLGNNNFLFVGSSTDMFAKNVNSDWITDVINRCFEYSDNKYLFQSKNPKRFLYYKFPINTILCTTIETTINYNLSKAPDIYERFVYIEMLKREKNFKTMITLEPLLEFDLESMLEMLQWAKPNFVNIGADSKNHNLPEPNSEKVKALISELEKFTKVHQKDNLKRLLKGV